ncbi:MAG: alginate lyase family protein [Chloroflexota bacterium]
MNPLFHLRASWMTARRAGLRRVGHRIQRRVRLRFFDPYWAHRLYPPPTLNGASPAPLRQSISDLIRYFIRQRSQSHFNHQWDQSRNQLTLLNQKPFALGDSLDWQSHPSPDPLWAFQLHGWEWLWGALMDEDAYEEILLLTYDWIRSHPIGRGIAWEPYPTSRRLIVWSAAWVVLGSPPELTAALAQQTAFLADHLERDLENNHLIANAKALAWVGILLAELPQAESWRTLGLDCLWTQLKAQVNPDGGHEENSSGYHLAVWLDGMETALLSQAAGQPVPSEIWTILEKMGEFAFALRRPDGRLPLLNDSIQDEPLPLQTIFSLAADLFDRDDFGWAAGREEYAPPALIAKGFDDTGYAILRMGTDPETETYLLFDAGNLGPDHCPGHGHADALSIELWSQGQPILIDPGTYQYPAGEWRDYFRGTAAHSTATIDDENQSIFAGPFRIADMAHARLDSVTIEPSYLEARGEHDGYLRLKSPVLHKRRVRLHGADLVTVEDTFEGEFEHTVALHFHLTPCHVDTQGMSSAVASLSRGLRVEFTVSSAAKGQFKVEPGWISRGWYEKEESPVLVYRATVELPVTMTTHISIKG